VETRPASPNEAAGLVSTSVASASEGSGRWYALLVGIPILVYVTRGLLRALIGVHRLVWGESRATVAKPTLVATLIFLVYLLGGLLVTGLANWARATSGGLAAVGVIGALLAYGLIWILVTLRLPHRDAPWRALLPGAALFAVGLTAMHALAAFFLVPYVVSKGGTYGALGVAAGLLFGLYLLSRLMVYAAVVNATLWERGAVLGS